MVRVYNVLYLNLLYMSYEYTLVYGHGLTYISYQFSVVSEKSKKYLFARWLIIINDKLFICLNINIDLGRIDSYISRCTMLYYDDVYDDTII